MIHRVCRVSRLFVAVAFCLCSLAPAAVLAQANGQLQIHQIRVGQGDSALIVSPMGETLLIDSGPESASSCASTTGIITYLTSIGLTRLDYHVASHYDADHMGCTYHINHHCPIGRIRPPGPLLTLSRRCAGTGRQRKHVVHRRSPHPKLHSLSCAHSNGRTRSSANSSFRAV